MTSSDILKFCDDRPGDEPGFLCALKCQQIPRGQARRRQGAEGQLGMASLFLGRLACALLTPDRGQCV
jgi:hypothetical protein